MLILLLPLLYRRREGTYMLVYGERHHAIIVTCYADGHRCYIRCLMLCLLR